MTPLLEINNLTKIFRVKNFFGGVTETTALNGVSLRINRGEAIGIVGESGCGKSTLANLLIRLEEPTSGEILLDGTDIAHRKEHELKNIRNRIQIVFQDPYSSLSPRMTVADILMEPMKIAGNRDTKAMTKKITELLELVGMRPDSLSRYPHEFSGGQRQRLSIARALTTEPDILILDEPTSALDVSVQAQVLNILADLRSHLNLTYLFISHNLAVIKYISDKTAVMYKGALVEVGPSNQILSAPLHPYTRDLLEAVPLIGKPFKPPVKGEGGLDSDNIMAACPYYARCIKAESDCATIKPVLTPCSDEHSVSCLKS